MTAQALKALEHPDINFPVELKPLYIATPAREGEPNYMSGEGGSFGLGRIPKRMAVVRTDTLETLNVVSERYKLVPHAEVFKPVALAIEELDLPLLRTTVATANRGGYARFGFVFDIGDEVIPGDKVRLVLTARNSLNYESRMVLSAEALREVCSNGMMAPIPGFTAGFEAGGKHTSNLNVAAAIAKVQQFVTGWPKLFERWRAWTEHPFDAADLAQLLATDPGVSKKAAEEIGGYFITRPDRINGQAPANLWEAYNAITWFATHRVSSRTDRSAVAQDAYQRLAVKLANMAYVRPSEN